MEGFFAFFCLFMFGILILTFGTAGAWIAGIAVNPDLISFLIVTWSASIPVIVFFILFFYAISR